MRVLPTVDGQNVVPPQDIETVAVTAATAAGKLLDSSRGDNAVVDRKPGLDSLVTRVDKACEELIFGLVSNAFPDHWVLGEEHGLRTTAAGHDGDRRETSELDTLWIVDPVDGTTNYVHGLPGSVVSIAVARRGVLVLGVVYDPSRDELFVARRGGGAYLNGRRISVSRELTLGDALVATGVPGTTRKARESNLRCVTRVGPVARSVRILGAAALHLAYVAAGRLSGFWELDLRPWDVAAGVLLVVEAGGRVTETTGAPYTLDVRDLMATNGAIHAELAEVLVTT